MQRRLRIAIPTILVAALIVFVTFRKPLQRSINLYYGRDLSHSDIQYDLRKATTVMLACQDFIDLRKRYPFSDAEKRANRPEISWRVVVFPYAKQTSLYDAYSPDQAWNSEKNLWLIEEFESTFSLSNGNIFSAIKTEINKWADVKDGIRHTIAIIENPNLSSGNWTQPNDLTIDEAVELVWNIKEGDSLIAANYDCQALRIRSPKLTRVTKSQIRSAFDGNDGIEFNLSKLE